MRTRLGEGDLAENMSLGASYNLVSSDAGARCAQAGDREDDFGAKSSEKIWCPLMQVPAARECALERTLSKSTKLERPFHEIPSE